jgi:UPF0755 protein
MKKKLLTAAAIALFLTVAIFSYTIFDLQKEFALADKEIVFEISQGESGKKIFKNLEDQKLIDFHYPHYLFFNIVKKLNKKIFFKSGEYSITSEDNYFSLISKFIKGDVYLRRITITEGQTITEAINILKANEFLSGEITIAAKEGSILPETYFFKKGDSREGQLKLMQDNLSKILQQAWDSRGKDLPLRNKEELLILASIVEKETGHDSERSHVAGVFVNRIIRRMRLQSDPTVIYAITKGKYKLERQLSKRNLRKVSPYNTYMFFGLPPAPICNPGSEAIFATAKPLQTKDLYFVANGKGGHSFAKNLKGHNRNVAILRQYEKKVREQKL